VSSGARRAGGGGFAARDGPAVGRSNQTGVWADPCLCVGKVGGKNLCPPADHRCLGERFLSREAVVFSRLASCLSAAAPLPPNFGSSEEELYTPGR